MQLIIDKKPIIFCWTKKHFVICFYNGTEIFAQKEMLLAGQAKTQGKREFISHKLPIESVFNNP